jgi:hypothetical protein
MRKPTRILSAPRRGRSGNYIVWYLETDVGTLELSQAAGMFKWLTRSSLYHRIFNARNTSWRDANIFDEIIPKTKAEPVPQPDAKPLPAGKRRREIESIKHGTWERKEKVWAKFKLEQTVKHLPARDAEYRQALQSNLSWCR